MKKSFKRVITTVTAVLSLSIGMVQTSLSAGAWGLYNTPSGPSEANKYTDSAGFYVNSETKSIKEACTSYTSNTQSNGSTAYASYKPYAIDSSGNRITIVNSTYYHYGTLKEHTITLTNTVPADSTIYGNYTLNNYSSIYTAIYGTIKK